MAFSGNCEARRGDVMVKKQGVFRNGFCPLPSFPFQGQTQKANANRKEREYSWFEI